MSSINNCNKKEENKNINEDHKKNQRSAFRDNFFNLDIKDDIYDPFKDDFFGFDSFENKIFRNFRNIFKIFDEKKETEKPKEVEEEPKEIKSEEKMEEEKEEEEINTNTKKEEEINTNTKKEEEINTNTKEEEKMEEEETYKNSNGIYKSSYQRGLDDKITRYIKEKNMKTGKKNQKKIIKGIEENEINDFNKTYNDYSKQCGFKKYFKNFDPFGFNRKQLSNESNNLFFHKLLF